MSRVLIKIPSTNMYDVGTNYVPSYRRVGGGVGGGSYCFWEGSHWRQRWHKTSCPPCNLNNLENILTVLSRNVELEEKMCRVQE